jgi:hypothetical protein
MATDFFSELMCQKARKRVRQSWRDKGHRENLYGPRFQLMVEDELARMTDKLIKILDEREAKNNIEQETTCYQI